MNAAFDALPGNVRGGLWIVASALTMSLQAATIKHLGDGLHSLQITFFRCLFGLLLVVPLLVREGGPKFRLSSVGLHLGRAAAGLTSMACGFYAYTMLPLAEATAFTFTMPLFLLVLGTVVLGERIGWRRTTAALVGFAGVLIMLRPGAHALQVAAMVALLSAFFHACVGVLIKKLAALESSGMIVLYFNVAGVLVFALPAWLFWQPLDANALFWLFTTALTGMASQLAVIEACKVAQITAVAPMDYSRLLFSTTLGFMLFAELPDFWALVGAAVIIGSTLYINYRELMLVRRARRERLAAPPPEDVP